MRSAAKIVVIILILVVGGGLLLAFSARVHEAANRMSCTNNLKQIGLAVNDYHSMCSCFPPAAMPNPDLPYEKCLSWLVCIVPFVQSSDLYSRLDVNKDWDAEANRFAVLTHWPVYTCPANRDSLATGTPVPAHYVGIAGIGSDAALLPLSDPKAGVFGYDRRVAQKDVKDGLAFTLVVMETATDNGPWTAGGPATVRGLDTTRPPFLGDGGQFSSRHRPRVTNALFADGSVRSLSDAINPQVLEALATMAGGEEVSVDALP
jgi:prepilin-type processing-associated H-X9-DG protein